MVPATNSLQSYLWETSDFCKCTWLSPKSSRFAGRKSFQQSCSGNGLSLIPINHGGNLPHICQSRFLSQSLPPALEDSRADGRVAAGITKMRVPPLWLGFFPRGQAGAATGISLCCFWRLPPDGQDLWCQRWGGVEQQFGSVLGLIPTPLLPFVPAESGPIHDFLFSLLLLRLCRAAQKFIRQASLPALLPLALGNIDVL